MKTKAHERTLVLLKPDAVQRGLIGEIISRFERKGLKIVAMKMVWPDIKTAQKHYSMPKSDMQLLGERTIAAYKEKGIELQTTPIEWAKKIIKRLENYITAGPILAIVIEGAHAVEVVRKIRGATNPLAADVGTISADLSIDSYFVADESERAIRNLVHASGSTEEASREINIWFNDNEIVDYELAIEQVLYSKAWDNKRKDLIKAKHKK